MEAQQVLDAIAEYRKFFVRQEVKNEEFPLNRKIKADYHAIQHAHSMLDQMEEMVQKGNMEKVFRWLGFVQGILFSTGSYTIDQMRDHNR